MKLFTKIALLLTLVFVSTNVNAQFKDFGLKGGVQINGVMPATEFEDDNGISLSSYLFRGFLRFELSESFNAEIGAGYGKLSGDDFNYATMKTGTGEYNTSIIPIDARLLFTPWNLESWNPYIYAGIGLLNYNVGTKPSVVSPLIVEAEGWTAVIPFGIGTEIKLSDEVCLDLSVGVNYSLTENLNFYKIVDLSDGYFNIGAGITFTGEGCNTDKDGDGLTRCEEEELGTDPTNPDTDSDGLKDGAEVNQYKTDPKNPDTDGDGLKDGEEVMKYNTNPLKADTDNDGLNDYDEVMTNKTDPLNPDTDADGLKDGEEVLKYKTSPFNADTDSDGLKDGEEVMKYKTDPLKADTDGGTVYDGVEVNRGTNPLDPKDDVPQAEVIIQKLMTFDNVLFGVNRAELTATAKTTLDNVYDACLKLNDAKLQLSGHTSSPASEEYNMELSLKRVNAVKEYFVKKGFNADLIYAEAFGEMKPVAPNDTKQGRAKNRRTEIKVAYIEKQ
jgi:outer membrane protein OmpA-like peptidoglycan-associated protein